MFDARLRSNIYALYLVQGLNYALSLATTPFLTRMLEPTAYGQLSVAFAAITYGVLFTDFGFNLSATREIAVVRDDKAAVARIFWRVNVAKTILMLISCAALTALTFSIPDWRAIAPIYLCSLLYIVSSVFFPIWYFQGFEEFRIASFLMVVSRAAMLGFLLYCVNSPDDVALAVFLQAAPQILAGALWWCSGWGLPRPAWVKPDWSEIRISLRAGWPFFLSALATNLYITSTAVILGFYAPMAQVGFFAAVMKLVYPVQGLLGPLVQATYPRISQLAATDKKAAYALIQKAFYLQGAGGLILTLILMLGAPWIAPLMFGQGMVGASEVLFWLAPVVLFGALANVFGTQSLIPFGQERYFSRVLISAGILHVSVLTLVLSGVLPWIDPERKAMHAGQVVTAIELFIVCAFAWRATKLKASWK